MTWVCMPSPATSHRRWKAAAVATDVERVLWAGEIPSEVLVSGHVYDVETGLLTTLVDAKSKK